MLLIKVNVLQFDYDIHALVKAFYPQDEVKVGLEREGENSFLSVFMEAKSIRIVSSTDYIGTLSREWKGCVERSEYRNFLKRLLYQMLNRLTNKTLLWGTLTGIRPTKMPMALLQEGKNEKQIFVWMKDTYFMSPDKAALTIEVARNELKILEQVDSQNGYSLYIGIPFCPTTCLYCSFTSYPLAKWVDYVDAYIEAVIEELTYVAERFKDRVLSTVYIGGGTPTTLEPAQLTLLLKKLTYLFDFGSVHEFTVEAGRPDSITLEKLQVLRRFGVNRISINPQTLKQATLDLIGRHHTVNQINEAMCMAREVGFTNINMDFIVGLPGETEGDVQETMDRMKCLHPDSVTIHSLAVKRGSKLLKWIEENGRSELYNSDRFMQIASNSARAQQMSPYYLYRQKNTTGNLENIGYAKEGKPGIYNILMMEDLQTIVAVGAGTVSKLILPAGRIERCDTHKDLKLYMEHIPEMIERKQKLFAIEDEIRSKEKEG